MNENEIKNLIDVISNKKILDLVGLMKPLDIVHYLIKKADLHPKEASKIAINLLKKVHSAPLKKEADFVEPTPATRERPPGWPYDGHTVAIMDPHNKGIKMGLNQGAEDIRKNGPGGTGTELQQKSAPHSIDGDQSSSSSSWNTTGPKGWSRSINSFEMPDDSSPQATPIVTAPVINTKSKKVGFKK
jgi:hypothetical protein